MTPARDTARDTVLPVVAVVGRPNVGKSSLVNRVLGRREAIVEETPGVTRDRHAFAASWRDRSFELVDTGGLEPGAAGLDARVADQARVAMELADVIVLVVDGQVGIQSDDMAVAELLRRTEKPVIVAVNKVDDASTEPEAASFFSLGLGTPQPVSALHGRRSGDLLDALLDVLPELPGDARGDAWAKVAIVGRPNVGKSSLLNALAGEERALTDPAPGTTRDPVDSHLLTATGRRITVVDTAGMRRRVAIKDALEYFSFLRSRKTLTRVDAAVLVVDVSEGATGLDQRIAEDILDAGRACVVVLNKWDLMPEDPTDRERAERDLATRLRFLGWAPRLRTSARTGRGVDRVVPALETAVAAHRRRLPTSEVNRIFTEAQEARPVPRSKGRANRILYAVQAATAPPRFLAFARHRLDEAYVRYLENRVRAVEPFEGSPVRIEVRASPRRPVEG